MCGCLDIGGGGRLDRAGGKERQLPQLRATDTGVQVDQEHDAPRDSAAWRRLEDQIAWYDRKSGENQRWFKRLKVCQLVTAAGIPVAAGVSAPVWLVGGGGALIVVLEGLQQLQQYQQNWTTYRSTCERLKHEKYLFLAKAGAYASATDAEADAILAERVEGLVSQEHAAWVAHRDEAAQKTGETK